MESLNAGETTNSRRSKSIALQRAYTVLNAYSEPVMSGEEALKVSVFYFISFWCIGFLLLLTLPFGLVWVGLGFFRYLVWEKVLLGGLTSCWVRVTERRYVP